MSVERKRKRGKAAGTAGPDEATPGIVAKASAACTACRKKKVIEERRLHVSKDLELMTLEDQMRARKW